MAADLPCQNGFYAHGWWNEEQKKSLGNVIDPHALADMVWTRLVFLMREVPFGDDGDFLPP